MNPPVQSRQTIESDQMEFGNIVRLNPRDAFKDEARDFTPWLAQNLEYLGNQIGLDLELVATEQPVGDFNADIVAKDINKNRTVIVENQLAETDHNHLGQLITYASGLGASIVVWVSKEFREQHREAIDWLNSISGADVGFFGLKIDVIRIDKSRPAIELKIVASPNEWAKESREVVTPSLSDKQQRYKAFFQSLIDELRETHRFTNSRAAQPQNWHTFATGTSGVFFGANFTSFNNVRVELYIDTRSSAKNTAAIEHLRKYHCQIATEFPEELSWEPLEERRASRVAIYRSGTIFDSHEALEQHKKWCIERLLHFKRVFGPKIQGALDAASGE